MLHWDDGVSIITDFNDHEYYEISFGYKADENGAIVTVNITRTAVSVYPLFSYNSVKFQDKVLLPALENIEIFGYEGDPDLDTLTVNGESLEFDQADSSYDSYSKVLVIGADEIIPENWDSSSTYEIKWQNQGINSQFMLSQTHASTKALSQPAKTSEQLNQEPFVIEESQE
ncbi:hypothetical protein L596_021662 [Steinernema carpocapsae]|uniref:Uncharacterized protein n=1 Tax=Steinernema carpocapsae TaxID=34508 RepID=A0A4U5MK86_STECR|nr:hypothetical protein L596_021662 [Steinernema carpocapsae]